jgi:RNA polymerase subunit RPABC4/transcription elongation factor Spt4
MVRGMSGKCPVCGLATTAAACPRCGTILVPGQAICPKCGKMFPGRIAVCDACGSDVGGDLDASEEQVVRGFALVPGMDDRTARRLYDRGFRDFADVIKLGLPGPAVARGLHHTISRKILLASALPKPAPSRIGRTTCLQCHGTVLESETQCPACGAALGPEAEKAFIEARLAEVQGSLTPLAEDPDFRAMPETVRSEILQEIGTMLLAPSLPTDAEFSAQIDAWRARGFDVEPVLVLLAQHPNNFRERAVRLIRSQIRKTMEGKLFKCPLCEVYLDPTAEECSNCGAKFA